MAKLISTDIYGSLLVQGTLLSNSTLTGTRLISTVATGTAPLTVASTTLVTNLNAQFLNGQNGAHYLNYTNLTNIPSTFTPSAHALTSHTATAWRMFFSNATTTAIQELAFGTVGTYLRSGGATSNPTWATIAYSEISGTPTIPTGFTISAGATDGLFDITGTGGTNSVTYSLAPYSVQQALLSFDTSTSNPSRTDRLNLNGILHATRFVSTVPIGTAPLTVISTTKVDNLNADLLDGLDSTAFYLASNPAGYTNNTGTVTSVAAGNGMNFTTITGAGTVTMGTPSALTDVTTNSASGTTHTHSITNFALSGTANVISVSGTPKVLGSASTLNLLAGHGDTVNPYASKTQKTFLAAPNAADGVPTFRTIVASDIPTLNQSTTGNAGSSTLIATTQKSDNVNYQVPFVTSVTAGNQALHTDSAASITFNPLTDVLNVPNLTVTGNITVNNVEMISTSNGIVFEGTTNDDFETTLRAIDPTADRIIELPNLGGTVALTSQLPTVNDATLTLAASTGISLSATPTFTANASANKTITITNSAPDQTVVLTGAGATTVSGTYPNFTITSTDTNSGGTVTSVSAGTQISGMAMTITNGTTTPSIATSISNAANFRTAIGAGTGNGTVTSVGGTGTVSGLTLGGTVTTTGNLTLSGTLAVAASNFSSQTANTFLAAPNGTAGVPTFRTIVAADVPTLNQNTTGTSGSVVRTVTGTTSAELVRGNMADNDQFRILVGGTASNAGFAEIATADDGTEPIHVRQYTGVFTSLVRTATLLDGSGNTSFPGTVTTAAINLSGTSNIVQQDGVNKKTANFAFDGTTLTITVS